MTKKYLPFLIIGAVVLVVVLMFRRKATAANYIQGPVDSRTGGLLGPASPSLPFQLPPRTGAVVGNGSTSQAVQFSKLNTFVPTVLTAANSQISSILRRVGAA